MSWKIDYSALPVVCELLGVVDVERLLGDLVLIRNFEMESDDG